MGAWVVGCERVHGHAVAFGACLEMPSLEWRPGKGRSLDPSVTQHGAGMLFGMAGAWLRPQDAVWDGSQDAVWDGGSMAAIPGCCLGWIPGCCLGWREHGCDPRMLFGMAAHLVSLHLPGISQGHLAPLVNERLQLEQKRGVAFRYAPAKLFQEMYTTSPKQCTGQYAKKGLSLLSPRQCSCSFE